MSLNFMLHSNNTGLGIIALMVFASFAFFLADEIKAFRQEKCKGHTLKCILKCILFIFLMFVPSTLLILIDMGKF